VLVVGAVGTGIGVRMGDSNRSDPVPAETVGIVLPIEYPAVRDDLPDLGDAPGPLAAIWLVPRVGDRAPEAVALVAETGIFGTLPIDLPPDDAQAPELVVALAPDGRRIAYPAAEGGLVVHQVVTGETESLTFDGFGTRAGYTWVDGTHLVGHVAGGYDVDGWVWEPGTAPTLVDLRTYPGSPWLGPMAGTDPWFLNRDAAPSCQPTFQDQDGPSYQVLLCDALGVIGSETVLTHDGNGRVVALDRPGPRVPFEDPAPLGDPALRDVVDSVSAPVSRGGQGSAPWRVTFATALIGQALAADGGGS
jgi:hypothetical protein